MANTKITKSERYSQLAEIVRNAGLDETYQTELLEFIDKEKNALNRKPSKADKEKAEQNKALALDVLNVLEDIGETSVSNLIKIGGFDVSTQKMTPILRSLMEENKVKAQKVKGVNMYSLV